MHCHCGINNRAPRWTFTDPCKPEVRPGAREEIKTFIDNLQLSVNQVIWESVSFVCKPRNPTARGIYVYMIDVSPEIMIHKYV